MYSQTKGKNEEDCGRQFSYGTQGGFRSPIERRSSGTLMGYLSDGKKRGRHLHGDIIPCGYRREKYSGQIHPSQREKMNSPWHGVDSRQAGR